MAKGVHKNILAKPLDNSTLTHEGEDIQNDVSKLQTQFQELNDQMVTKVQLMDSQNMTKMEMQKMVTISLRET